MARALRIALPLGSSPMVSSLSLRRKDACRAPRLSQGCAALSCWTGLTSSARAVRVLFIGAMQRGSTQCFNLRTPRSRTLANAPADPGPARHPGGTMPATIGFVGLGAMGAEMAETLVSKQWRVVGYDIRREAIDRLVKNGGHAAASAAEAAKGAEALVLMVVNAEQAENILFKDGALEALPASGTVILMSTCAPGRVEAIAERVVASGRKFVDAPVSGGITGAKGGSLT